MRIGGKSILSNMSIWNPLCAISQCFCNQFTNLRCAVTHLSIRKAFQLGRRLYHGIINTLTPSSTTSGPVPSPGITAISCDLLIFLISYRYDWVRLLRCVSGRCQRMWLPNGMNQPCRVDAQITSMPFFVKAAAVLSKASCLSR